MYLSHPVRRVRDDPIEDAEVRLVVTPTDEADVAALESALESIGEAVDCLPYDALEVTVPETAVAEVCELPDIDSIETAGTVGIGGDAGEDL